MPPLLPMPGEGGAAGRGGAIGAAGFAATGAGAIGFGAITGFAAGALRAAGFRTAFLVVLRAEVFFAVVLRAVARFAVVLRAPVLRAVLRAARAVLRTVRAAFLAVLRGLAFLLVVRFFPLVLVAMACAPLLLCWRTRPLKRTRACTNHASLVQACRPTGRVNCFFHYTMIARESGNLGHHGKDFNLAVHATRTLHRTRPVTSRMGHCQDPTGLVNPS